MKIEVECKSCGCRKYDGCDCVPVMDSYLFDTKLWGSPWFGVRRIRHIDHDVVWFVHLMKGTWKLPITYKGPLS